MDLNRDIDIGPAGGLASRLAALGVLAVLIGAVVLGVALPLRALDAGLREEIAHYQRMLATNRLIAARKDELARAGDPRAMAELLIAGGSDSAAAAGLHERARELIAASRGALISIQALPPAAEGGTRRIGLRVQFAADLPGFQRIVYAFESGRPAVLVTNLYLRARTARATGLVNPLDVQMDLFAFRRDGAG